MTIPVLAAHRTMLPSSSRTLSNRSFYTICRSACRYPIPYPALSRRRHIVISSAATLTDQRFEALLDVSGKRYMTVSNNRENPDGSSPSSMWTTRLSKREMADLEDWLSRRVGKRVHDSVVDQDLESLQWIHPRIAVSAADGTLQMLLKLPNLLHPNLDELKRQVGRVAEEEVQAWRSHVFRATQPREKRGDDSSRAVNVNVEAIATKPVPVMAHLVEDKDDLLAHLGPGLECVSHFVAVYSCKGGVGKSSVAVNLAFELAQMGGRVGLLDLDIYGPSLPVLVRPEDPAVRQSPKGSGMVYPIEYGGVKMLSLGFVAQQSGVPGSGQDNGASVMRGPMAGKVVTQLLKRTDWGDLDVLLLDLPPGTGDVQLAVLQELQLSGAVAVTTPSKLAAVDTRKGVEMFTSLGVPTLAVVENMSYFEVDGTRHYPFGPGISTENTSEKSLGSTMVVQLPLSSLTNAANENGVPFCLSRPEQAEMELSAFRTLAQSVSGSLLQYQFGRNDGRKFVVFPDESEKFDVSTTTLAMDKSYEDAFVVRLFSDTVAVQKRINPAVLRSRDPKTGDVITESPFLDVANESEGKACKTPDPIVIVQKTKGKRSPSITPMQVNRRGRYGFSVNWADGATIIYSMSSIAKAAGGDIQE